MSRDMVYLDWNATAPLRESVMAGMASGPLVGNPSSPHALGREAWGMIDTARRQVAGLVDCDPGEVVFTSGATEAAGVLDQLSGRMNILVEETSHDCLWTRRQEGIQVHGKTLMAMGVANSETGILLDLPERGDGGKWRHESFREGADMLLLDVTQAVGRVPFSFRESGADMAILSSHKLGGPKGAGALILRSGLDIEPLQKGGGQEFGRRSGTENVLGIKGFGIACEEARADLASGVWDGQRAMLDQLERRLKSDLLKVSVVGLSRDRLPNTSCLVAHGWRGDAQVIAMDMEGIAVSAGSACSSGKVKASRVLMGMGHSETAASCAIRVSIGPRTEERDIERFAEAWSRSHKRVLGRAGRKLETT